MANLNLVNVNKSFGGTHVLHDINLSIGNGEFVVFVGPSGCGKSTLLRTVSGLEEISSGDMYINDVLVNDMTPAERKIGMVFQSYALYPHMSVSENMTFSLKLKGISKTEREKASERIAKILELEGLLERKPKALSGGQRQRVAIGRALAKEPNVFLFDEPLSNLDAKLRVQMRMEISRLHKQLQTTMIYVTHDQVEAMTLADRIVVLNSGRIEQVGSPLELYHNPTNQFVAGFIGSPKMNFLSARIVDKSLDGYLAEFSNGAIMLVGHAIGDLTIGEKVVIGVRPECINVSISEGICGEVGFVEQLGSESLYYVSCKDSEEPIVVRRDAGDLVVTGSVLFSFAPNDCYIFDIEGQNRSTRKENVQESIKALGQQTEPQLEGLVLV
jgi:multiple sugar transport system ATP-binding protein